MHFGQSFAGESFGDFQGASEAAVSAWILPESGSCRTENRQKHPGPEGLVENGLAVALRLALPASSRIRWAGLLRFSRIRGCALTTPCRQPVLNPTNDCPKCMTGSKSGQRKTA